MQVPYCIDRLRMKIDSQSSMAPLAVPAPADLGLVLGGVAMGNPQASWIREGEMAAPSSQSTARQLNSNKQTGCSIYLLYPKR